MFSELIAPFPYPKLALIVGATKFGGMENAGAIVFSANLLGNFETAPRDGVKFDAPRRVIDVVAHETAHQWFGDSVTESTWADLWLSEGFATYFAGLFRERTEGPASFRAYMEQAAQTYFTYEKNKRNPIHDTETSDLMALLNANNYQKGAWVLHMLRGVLGDQAFFVGLRSYYHDHQGGTATTDDLRRALEKASGRDLREFFDRWVNASGHPVYDVTWRWSKGVRGTQGVVTVTVAQTQPDAAFLMPVPIEIRIGALVQKELIVSTGKNTTVSFPVKDRPTHVLIDPNGWVLKEAQVREVLAAAAGR
jgi:aminopeptidase N